MRGKRLWLPDRMPDDMLEVLGLHPGIAIKFAFVARNAGYAIPYKAEAELAFVHWHALTCYLRHGPKQWRAALDAEFNDMLAKARVRTETSLAERRRLVAEANGTRPRVVSGILEASDAQDA